MGYIIGLTLFEEEVFVVQLRHDGRAGEGVSGCGAREREEHGVLAQERSLDSEGVVAGRVFLYLHQSVHSLHRAEYLNFGRAWLTGDVTLRPIDKVDCVIGVGLAQNTAPF
jgi:hypothetical protein